jgi:DNA polymerase III delta prime subunit
LIIDRTFVVLILFKENIFSSLILYGPLNSGKISLLKNVSHQFFGKYEKMQIMTIKSIGKFQSLGLSNKIDDFRSNHFYPDKIAKIIIFENFGSLGNLAQMSLRERMQKENIKTKFWITTQSFSKINQVILSRCNKLYFNLVYPSLILIRFIEILNKEDILVSIENLQYLVNSNRSTISISLEAFSSNPYNINATIGHRPYFYNQKLSMLMCVDNLTRENNRVLFRKIKFHGFSNYIMSKKSIGNSRRQFYSFLALISF